MNMKLAAAHHLALAETVGTDLLVKDEIVQEPKGPRRMNSLLFATGHGICSTHERSGRFRYSAFAFCSAFEDGTRNRHG